MDAHPRPTPSPANVVGQIRGRELPDEVVVRGGHLDSWDAGAGATDDGGGCVVTWEALRLMKNLNLRPRRTVRVVLWTNERRGGAAVWPIGISIAPSSAACSDRIRWRRLPAARLRLTGNDDSSRGSCKAIATWRRRHRRRPDPALAAVPTSDRSVQEGHVPAMSLEVDGSQYFRIHHTPADTIDKIDPVEMAKCAAVVAVMAYVVADLPQRIGS
jgi:carboxypeptidase Q